MSRRDSSLESMAPEAVHGLNDCKFIAGSGDVSGLSEPYFWSIFPRSALDNDIAICYTQYSTSQYLDEGEGRTQAEEGTVQVGM